MNLKHIFFLGIKELRSFFRDPILLIFVMYSFSLAIFIVGTAKPDTLYVVPIAVVDEDQTQLSRRLIDAFVPPYFTTPSLINQNQMDSGMDRGVYTFALDIPENFEKDVISGKRPTIQLNVDATRLSQAFAGTGYVQSIIYKELMRYLTKSTYLQGAPIELTERTAFNPLRYEFWFGSIFEIINNITLISIVLTGAALIREREHGTIEHLLVMPVTPFEIMVSKIWPMMLLVLAASIFSLGVMVQAILKVPIQGSLAYFIIGTLLHLFATTSLGIFLSTISKTMPQFGLTLMLILIPLQVLSGGMTPRESMPEFVQYIMLAAPNTHFVALAQSILIRGAGMSVVWKSFVALLLIASTFFTLSLMRFKKMMQSVG